MAFSQRIPLRKPLKQSIPDTPLAGRGSCIRYNGPLRPLNAFPRRIPPVLGLHGMPIQIRKERPGDEKAVFEVNFHAFGRDAESKIIDLLRINCPERTSLVAVDGGKITGHILFTPARIACGQNTATGMGLAPLAVDPECQRKGIGTALLEAGLTELRAAGVPFIAVVGHPGFYPKFGFEKASKYGLRCEYDAVPDEAFMILVFQPQAIQRMRGTVKMRPEFSAAI
jgi:putative acetyltransferase